MAARKQTRQTMTAEIPQKKEWTRENGPTERIKVRVREDMPPEFFGSYQYKRRRPGDVFYLIPRYGAIGKVNLLGKPTQMGWLTAEQQFAESWMEKVAESTPEKVSTAQDAINRRNEEFRQMARGRSPDPQSYAGSAEPARVSSGASDEVI